MCNPAAHHRTRPRSHTLCSHTRLYYLYQKMWAARVSFIHCSAFGRVLAGDFSRVYSAAECLGEPQQLLVCVWQSVGALLSGAHRLLYGIRTSRLVYAPWIEYTNESHSSVQQLMGSALAGSQNDLHTEGPKLSHYLITRQQIDDILQYLEPGVLAVLGEKDSGRLAFAIWSGFDALRSQEATWRRSGCSTWRHSGCSWQWALLQPRMAR